MVEGEEYLTHSIIVSTGAESIWLNAPGEAEQKDAESQHVLLVMVHFLGMRKCWLLVAVILPVKRQHS